jgi:hypothetical protein
MNLEKHDKQQLSYVRMQRAYEFLADAKANLSEGRLKQQLIGVTMLF